MEKKSLSNYVSLIDKLIANGNFEPAYHHACYLLTQFPKFATLYRQIGRIQIEFKHFDQAIDIYLRQAAINPGDWQVFFTLAILHHRKERPDPAARYIAYASLLHPTNRDISRLYRRLKPDKDDRLRQDLQLFKEAARSGKGNDEISDPAIKLLAALRLAANSEHQAQNLREVNESILRKLPYCKQALMTLIGIYAKENDLTRFQRCADRLSELDPERSFAPDESNSFTAEKKNIALTYFDWTGYPNTRVRSIWQRAQSRYIPIEADRVADFLDLIPIPIDFVVTGHSDKPATDPEPRQFFRQDDWKSLGSTSEEDDLFFQQDYFQTQSAQLSELLSAPPSEAEIPPEAEKLKTAKTENSAQILDDAFDFLEKIVTEGFAPGEEDPIARTFGPSLNFQPDPNRDSVQVHHADAVAEPRRPEPVNESPNGEATPETDNEPDIRADGIEPKAGSPIAEAADSNGDGENRARDAWTTFSRGERSEAIEKYRFLIREGIETDQVRSDLQTLSLVFPEESALSELIQSLDEPNKFTMKE